MLDDIRSIVRAKILNMNLLFDAVKVFMSNDKMDLKHVNLIVGYDPYSAFDVLLTDLDVPELEKDKKIFVRYDRDTYEMGLLLIDQRKS